MSQHGDAMSKIHLWKTLQDKQPSTSANKLQGIKREIKMEEEPT